MLELYCTIHRPLDLSGTGIQTLQVGQSTDDFGDVRDNTGDNIAAKNTRYSELTGHYHVWKNRPAEMVGFCHYRRFLLPPQLSQWLAKNAIKPYKNRGVGGSGNYASGYLIAPEQLQSTLASCDYIELLQQQLLRADVLLPKSNALPMGGFLQQYGNAHSLQSFFQMLAIIASIDNKLARDAHRFFTDFPHAHWNNLFVMRWEVFSAYCDFLFDILSQADAQIAPLDSVYQNRVCAFLSERLLNFWVWKQGLSIGQLDWCMTQDIEDAEESHQRRPRTAQKE